jgi:hypothetical protein
MRDRRHTNQLCIQAHAKSAQSLGNPHSALLFVYMSTVEKSENDLTSSFMRSETAG